MGESGCGKTTVGRCILRLYEPTAGQVFFEGTDITHLPERKIRPLRREMGTVFQDPYNSLDPRQTAGSIVAEALRIYKVCKTRAELDARIDHLFREVELDPGMASRVAHEFSGIRMSSAVGSGSASASRPLSPATLP